MSTLFHKYIYIYILLQVTLTESEFLKHNYSKQHFEGEHTELRPNIPWISFCTRLAPQHFAIKMGLYVSTNPQQLTE